ncbi:hypothetical protein L6Q79_16220, partial [bacterium]|nr:hypothetical protein [bacterium]
TPNHVFVDSYGNEVIGSTIMKSGWDAYFQMFPDYKIEVNEYFESQNVIVAVGYAMGTYMPETHQAENFWKLPAAWRMEEISGKVHKWQVIADTKIPFDIIAKNENRNR